MSVISHNQLYRMFQDSWGRFCRRLDGMGSSTIPNTNFAEDASSLTYEMGGDFKMSMWHQHLKRAGMKLTYARRDPCANWYIQDPSDPKVPSMVIEIEPDVMLKIMALGYVP